MSKKRIPFATGGWVNTQSSGDMPFSDEMVVTKKEQELLSELLKEPPKVDAVAVVSGEDLMRTVLPKMDMPKVAIDPKVLEIQRTIIYDRQSRILEEKSAVSLGYSGGTASLY